MDYYELATEYNNIVSEFSFRFFNIPSKISRAERLILEHPSDQAKEMLESVTNNLKLSEDLLEKITILKEKDNMGTNVKLKKSIRLFKLNLKLLEIIEYTLEQIVELTKED